MSTTAIAIITTTKPTTTTVSIWRNAAAAAR